MLKIIAKTLIFTSLVALFVACKNEDSDIGASIMPSSDKLDLKCDTFDVDCYTVDDRHIATDEKTLSPLGVFVDPVFGTTKASFACHVRISEANVNFGNRTINSVKLQLKYRNVYGTKSVPKLDVYRLKTDLKIENTYYADMTFADTDIEPLALATTAIDTAGMLIVDLTDALKNMFCAENTPHFASDTAFINFFKGLYVKYANENNDNCVYVIDLLNSLSCMNIVYNDTLQFEIGINTKSVRINMFEHDTTNINDDFKQSLNDTLTCHKYCYIQNLGGTKAKLTFPQVRRFFNGRNNVVINKAKLIVNIHDEADSQTDMRAIDSMTMVVAKPGGNYNFVPDFIISGTRFGGVRQDNKYVFNIPLYIQDLIAGTDTLGLYMFDSQSRTQPGSVVINGHNETTNKLRLEIYYSEY